MSEILIRGMDMPTEKEEARLILITHDGRAVDPHRDEYEVIEVHDHGRLIDADAIISKFEKQREEDKKILCDERAIAGDYQKALYRYSQNGDFISMLKLQETVIPADKE